MDSNISAISNNGPVLSAPLTKPLAVVEKDLKEKRKELLNRLHPGSVTRIEPALFQNVNNPDIREMLEAENTLLEAILCAQENIKTLEEKINQELHKIDVTDNQGGNFLPNEEEYVQIPAWTLKGTHCSSTRQVREEAQKRARLEILYKQKFPEEPKPPPCNMDSELTKSIDNLYQIFHASPMPTFFDRWHQLDLIHELLGKDDVSAPRFQKMYSLYVQAEYLRGKEAAMETTLARLEFHREQKFYEYRKKTSDNMQNSISQIPKHNSKMLYCRNQACPDCKHTTKPSLKTHGLQNSGSRRKKQKVSQVKQQEPSTSRQRSRSRSSTKRRSPSRRRYSTRHYSPKRRSYSRRRSPPRQRSPTRRRSPSPAVRQDYRLPADYDDRYEHNHVNTPQGRYVRHFQSESHHDNTYDPSRQDGYGYIPVTDRLY